MSYDWLVHKVKCYLGYDDYLPSPPDPNSPGSAVPGNSNQSINNLPKSNNYEFSPVRRNLSNDATATASPVLIEDFDNEYDYETPINNDDDIVGGFSINSPNVDSFVSIIDRENTNKYNERQSPSK